VAERLREGFSHYSPWSQGEQPGLTLSVGVVQVMEEEDSVSLLKRAEAALDAADRRGGNRAYYHDGERCAPITAMLETMDYLA
jgi:GGDEF domain-containing protein